MYPSDLLQLNLEGVIPGHWKNLHLFLFLLIRIQVDSDSLVHFFLLLLKLFILVILRHDFSNNYSTLQETQYSDTSANEDNSFRNHIR